MTPEPCHRAGSVAANVRTLMSVVDFEAGRRRVVVTGLGAVTPLGADVETTWPRLVAGESGAGPITAFDTGGHSVRIACEADAFEPANWLDKRTSASSTASRSSRSRRRVWPRPIRDSTSRASRTASARDRDCSGRGRESGRVLREAESRSDPSEPRHRVHAEHGGGLGVDGARRDGPGHRAVRRLRCLRDGDRRRVRRDSAWPRRGDAVRRERGGRHAVGDGRLRRDARVVASQRRPGGASRPFAAGGMGL